MSNVKKHQENSGDSNKCRCRHVLHLLFRSGSVPALPIPSIDRRALNWRKSCMIHKVHFAAMAGVLSAGLLMPCASAAQTFELDSTKGLQPDDVTVEAVTYHGRKAVRVMPAVDADAELVAPKNGEGGGSVVLPGTWESADLRNF